MPGTSNRFISATPLYEGTYSVGTDKKFHRIKKTDPPNKGALKLSIHPFLLQTEERIMLFDTGLGDFGEETSTERILQNLADRGLTERDITDIFTSHLHIDHIGALAGKPNGYWELTFPDARIWVSRKDWEQLLTSEKLKSDELKFEFLHFLDARANLHFTDGEDQPYPDIRIKSVGGHTPNSQVLFYENSTDKYLMAGDIIGTKGEINRKFAAKYDVDPQKSMELREELKAFASENGYAIMMYHETDHPIVKLTNFGENKGYHIEPLESPESI